jgi:hypothetical protein
MNLPKFRSGQELNSTLLNQLSDGIRRAQVTSVIGGTFSSTPGGTAIIIDAQVRGGGSGGTATLCPFEVTAANVSPSEWKFKVEFGLIGGKIPTGMYPGGIPPLIMDWADGWVLAYVEFVTNAIAVQSVNIVVNADIPANTDVGAYYPLAYIFTDSTDPENPVQVIQNLCSQPTPSVCDLAFTPPA